MPIIKEFREFFLRAAQVNSGTKLDQEVGFPTDYYVTVNGVPTLVKNRFLKDHYPSEMVNKKLLESITFKKNPEDTAKDIEQGLVKTATDASVIARETPTDYGDSFIRGVQPHQVPEIVAGTNVTVTPSLVTDDGRQRQCYTISSTGGVLPNGNILLWSFFNNQTINGIVGDTPFTTFNGFTISAGFLEIGDVITIDMYCNNSFNQYVDASGATQTAFKGAIIKLGGTVLGLPAALITSFFGFSYQNRLRVKVTVMSNTTVFCEIETEQAFPSFLYILSLMGGVSSSAHSEYFDENQILTIPNHTTTALSVDFLANIPQTGSLEMYGARVSIQKLYN